MGLVAVKKDTGYEYKVDADLSLENIQYKLDKQGIAVVEKPDNTGFIKDKYDFVSKTWTEGYTEPPINKEALIQSASDQATYWINSRYDQMAINKVMTVRSSIRWAKSKGQTGQTLDLVEEIANAVERWMERVFDRYDEYKLQIENAKAQADLPTVDYSDIIGPPITFKEIKWSIDPKQQARYPEGFPDENGVNQLPNTDITFYQNF